MSNIKSRYPLSTTTGQYIPADVLKVRGIMRKDFSVTASVVDSLPLGTEIIRLRATENCFFHSGNAIAVVPASGSPSPPQDDTLLLIKDEWTLISVDSLDFSVIRLSTDGVLYIHILEKWNILALDVQMETV